MCLRLRERSGQRASVGLTCVASRKTAKALELTVPDKLHALADEVIE